MPERHGMQTEARDPWDTRQQPPVDGAIFLFKKRNELYWFGPDDTIHIVYDDGSVETYRKVER